MPKRKATSAAATPGLTASPSRATQVTGHDEIGELDLLFAAILSWPDVSPRRMFGAECFLVRGHMFAFTWEDDIAFWVPEGQYADALAIGDMRPLEIRPGIPMGTWLKFPLRTGAEMLPRLRQAHDHYRLRPLKKRRRRVAS